MPTRVEGRELDDATLARRCRSEDREAWRLLLRRHSPMVYRLALRMLRSPQDAEDASQETFMKVHRSFASYDATRPLAPWIGRIAYHVCLRRLAKPGQANASADPLELTELKPHDGPDPEWLASRSEANTLLEHALATLPAPDRALLVLRYREGLSDAEVARVAGMPVNTVKTRIFRAKGRLRDLLARHRLESPEGES